MAVFSKRIYLTLLHQPTYYSNQCLKVAVILLYLQNIWMLEKYLNLHGSNYQEGRASVAELEHVLLVIRRSQFGSLLSPAAFFCGDRS